MHHRCVVVKYEHGMHVSIFHTFLLILFCKSTSACLLVLIWQFQKVASPCSADCDKDFAFHPEEILLDAILFSDIEVQYCTQLTHVLHYGCIRPLSLSMSSCAMECNRYICKSTRLNGNPIHQSLSSQYCAFLEDVMKDTVLSYALVIAMLSASCRGPSFWKFRTKEGSIFSGAAESRQW